MPYKQSWLDLEQAMGGRMVLQGTRENMCTQFDQLAESLIPQYPLPSENVECTDGELDGIRYRVYKTKALSGPLPVCIWTHGGGFIAGDVNSDDVLCRIVAEHTSSVVVNVEYRLAPGQKWPTQLDDSMKLYKWAHANAASIGGDPKKFYTGGGSAGGGLALLVASRVVQDPQLKDSLKGVVALVPLTCHWEHVPEEYQSIYKSYTDNAKGVPIIDKASMEMAYSCTEANPKDPDAFVLLAKDSHKNFPPTYIASCEFDPLRDDSTAMVAALKKAGVATKHDYYEGFPHYFWIFPSVPESQQFLGNLLGGIEWIKSQM